MRLRAFAIFAIENLVDLGSRLGKQTQQYSTVEDNLYHTVIRKHARTNDDKIATYTESRYIVAKAPDPYEKRAMDFPGVRSPRPPARSINDAKPRKTLAA